MRHLIVTFMIVLLALGLTQPCGYMQSCNIREQYEQCSHEDHDITPLDFIFEHLLNLESIVNLFEGEHEYLGDDHPHLPFQNPESALSTFIAIAYQPYFELDGKQTFGDECASYPILPNDTFLNGFSSDIFRPPAFI